MKDDLRDYLTRRMEFFDGEAMRYYKLMAGAKHEMEEFGRKMQEFQSLYLGMNEILDRKTPTESSDEGREKP